MNQTARGFLVLLGSVLIHITLGVLYCFGNFSTYIASYLRYKTSFTDIRFSNTQWILTLMVCGQGTTMLVGGLLEKRIGTRVTILLGCISLTTTTALSYFSIKNFYGLIVTYGLLFGFSIGIAYSTALTLSMRWLPKYKGVVAGSVVAGFGLGAMVFNPIITKFINPDNVSPDLAPYPDKPTEKYFGPDNEAILNRVPYCFLVMAGFFLCLQTAGNLLLKPSPDQVVRVNMSINGTEDGSPSSDDKEDNYADQEEAALLPDQPRELGPLDLLKERNFWILWFAFFCNNQGICYCSTYWKSFGQGFINNDMFLAAIGSAGSVANALSRIFWGAVSDRAGYKISMSTLQAIFALLYVVMHYTQTGQWGYAVFIFLLFFCVGGSFSLLPAATCSSFGSGVNSSANYGLVFTSAVAGSLMNLLINSETTRRNWPDQHVQWIVAAFILAGCIGTLFYKENSNSGYQRIPAEQPYSE